MPLSDNHIHFFISYLVAFLVFALIAKWYVWLAQIPSLPVLGDYRSLNDIRHYLADFADRSLGIGYTGGSLLLFTCLMVVLAIWYWPEGTISDEQRKHATSRGLLLGGDHLFTDTRNRARRLDRRYRQTRV